MKRQLIVILASAALAISGCSKEPGTGEKGFGTLRIECAADGQIEGEITSRATITVPAGNLFAVTIKGGEGFDRTWKTIDDFTAENLLIKEGDYSAAVSYGDPEAEGLDKPYFSGTQNFTIEALRTSVVSISARLTNSMVLVRATKAFLNYFHDAKFTLKTASGYTYTFTPGAAGYKDVPVYVKAATSLTVNGTARRQSQTGTDEGLQVKFDEITLNATEPTKRHIYTFDSKNTGGATLKITIGDDYTETREIAFELNDDAVPADSNE